jgi:hypothetical protein
MKPYAASMPLDITWTRRAMRLPPEVREELARMMDKIHPHFTEIRRPMKVGITRFYDGLVFQSNAGKVKLMVDVHRSRKGGWKFPTYWTLVHEFMHLVQFNDDGIPGGERAIDIQALARVPPGLIDDSPCYLVVPEEIRDSWNDKYAELAHVLAKEALKKRRDGLRRYAVWWEDEFEKRAQSGK